MTHQTNASYVGHKHSSKLRSNRRRLDLQLTFSQSVVNMNDLITSVHADSTKGAFKPTYLENLPRGYTQHHAPFFCTHLCFSWLFIYLFTCVLNTVQRYVPLPYMHIHMHTYSPYTFRKVNILGKDKYSHFPC